MLKNEREKIIRKWKEWEEDEFWRRVWRIRGARIEGSRRANVIFKNG